MCLRFLYPGITINRGANKKLFSRCFSKPDDNGKAFERKRRKAMGLSPLGYDCQAAEPGFLLYSAIIVIKTLQDESIYELWLRRKT